MPTVSELMSRNISNAITNVKTWKGIIFNVKDYGAKGDGDTDDTGAFLEAVKSAQEVGEQAYVPATEKYYIVDTDRVNIAELRGPGLILSSNGSLISPDGALNSNMIVQKKMMEPFFGFNDGVTNTQIYPGSELAMQGITVINVGGKYKLFVVQRCAGTNYQENEKCRIVEFDMAEDGSVVQPVAFSEELDLGHGQDVGGIVIGGEVYLYTYFSHQGTFINENSGKGVSRVHWRGSATSQADVTNYQLFGNYGSDHRFADYNKSMVGLTRDGQYIIVCPTRESDSSRHIFLYDRDAVETATNPLEVLPSIAFTINMPFHANAVIQGIDADGKYIYIAYGYVQPLGYHIIQVYDYFGNIIRSIEVDDARAQYGLNGILNHPTLGTPVQMELEGLAVRGKEILIGVLDTWRQTGSVVTYDGKTFAAMSNNTGVYPTDVYTWVPSSKTAIGEWDSSTPYTVGNYTRRSKLIYSIRIPAHETGEEPIDNGIIPRSGEAAIKLRGSNPDILVKYGDTYQVKYWNDNLQKYVSMFSYGSRNALILFDSREGADNTRNGRITVTFTNNREILGVRSTENLDNGAGTYYYGNNDSEFPGYIRDFTNDSARRETDINGQTTFKSSSGYVPLTADRPDTGPIIIARRNGDMGGGIHMSTINTVFAAYKGRNLVLGTSAGEEVPTFRVIVENSDGTMHPNADNVQNLGTAATRWKEIFAGNGTINTSDRNEKDHIENIPDAVLDAWAEVNFRRFKFKDAITEKGENARWHIGLIAQEIVEAFQRHGLDATEYGIVCYDEWPEQQEIWEEHTDEETGEKIRIKVQDHRPAGSRWSIRPDECQFLEMALMRRELAKLRGGS